MLIVETITDHEDERIGDYRALTDVELRTRWEPPNGLFIAETLAPSPRTAGRARWRGRMPRRRRVR